MTSEVDRDSNEIMNRMVEAVDNSVSKDVSARNFDKFMEVVASSTAKSIVDDVFALVMAKVEPMLEKFIENKYGTIQRRVRIQVNDSTAIETSEMVNEVFEEVMAHILNREPVFICGPAGCGKNVLCKQIAMSLGMEFYYTNAVTQEYAIKGFTDAMGRYQETQFYKAFTQGGLFMLDEMDASIPEVLIILNGAIANGYFDFPAPIGRTDAHPNFRVIAAGNTFGHGASYQYVGRNQLDGASLDRFALIRMSYDPAVEASLAGGEKELLDFIREFRTTAENNKVFSIISYRAINRLVKLKNVIGLKKAIRDGIVKGMEHEDLRLILANMKIHNEYTDACKEILLE